MSLVRSWKSAVSLTSTNRDPLRKRASPCGLALFRCFWGGGYYLTGVSGQYARPAAPARSAACSWETFG